MLWSSGKTPLVPVVDRVLKESVDRFAEAGRQTAPLNKPEDCCRRAYGTLLVMLWAS